MSMLNQLQRGRASKPPRVLCYGVEGVGKSTFGSQTPKPIFIQTEDGLDEIDCDKFPLSTSYDDGIAALTETVLLGLPGLTSVGMRRMATGSPLPRFIGNTVPRGAS